MILISRLHNCRHDSLILFFSLVKFFTKIIMSAERTLLAFFSNQAWQPNIIIYFNKKTFTQAPLFTIIKKLIFLLLNYFPKNPFPN